MKPIGKIILPAVVATAVTLGHAARAIAGSLALVVALLWGNSMPSAGQTLSAVPDTITDFPCPSNPDLRCVISGLDNPRGMAFGQLQTEAKARAVEVARY